MKNEERRMYTLEAKALAEEQKRLNPDCWKRKRTNSVGFNWLLRKLLTSSHNRTGVWNSAYNLVKVVSRLFLSHFIFTT